MSIKTIITGASGMVGEGVLLECLNNIEVDEVLVIGRKACGIHHSKLKEILHQDFFDLSPIAHQLIGYNACYFCLGVSSIGMKEPEYFALTHTLAMNVGKVLSQNNPDMVFCYISGAATDSSEKGSSMWARVKGKTENDLMKLPFKKVYNFRPGFLKPTEGMRNTLSYYKYIGWIYKPIRTIFPQFVCTLKELGTAMIRASIQGYSKSILEVKDIVALAK